MTLGSTLTSLPGHGMDGELIWQGPTPTWKHPGTLQTQQPSRLNTPRPGDAGVGRALLESARCHPGSDDVTQKREARPQQGHGGQQVRLPGDKPQQLPRPGPPPSPFLHVWDSDRVCWSRSWFLRGSLGIPCPQHPCPSAAAPPAPCPTSQPTPLPAGPARPGNPAGAELRPAACSDPITAATVWLSPEAAPASPPGPCVHSRPAASQSAP